MRAAALTLSILLLSSSAAADDTSDLQASLDEPVVTTASQSAQAASTAPGTTTTITAEDLARWNITSLDQALDFLGLGVVTSNPLKQVDVGARGVMITKDQGNHFLLLVNGHVMNEPLFGSARFEHGNGIPFEMIDHIEVVIGPGSVLYGSYAMLGVINVVTKRAKDWKGAHFVGEFEPGKSWRAGGGAGATFSLFGKPAEVTFQVEGYRLFGPAFDMGEQITGIELADKRPERFSRDPNAPRGVWGGPRWGPADKQHYAIVPATLARVIVGDFELNLLASSYKRAAPYFDTSTREMANYNEPDNWELERSARFDLKWQKLLSPVIKVGARAYGDSFEYQRQGIDSRVGACLYQGVTTCDTHTRGYSRWAGVELQGSFDWWHDGTLVSLLGVDVQRAFVKHQSDLTDDDSGRALRSSQEVIDTADANLGAYTQHEWRPVRWFQLNAGARLDVGKRYDPVASPRVAAVVSPWRGSALKLVYAQAFRPPSWYELSAQRPTLLLARDLHPERVRSYEASLEQKLGTQRLFFGVFRTRWTDLIEDHVLSLDEAREASARGEIDLLRAISFRQYRNVATIENFGYDAGFDGSLLGGAFRYGASFTSSYAHRVDDAGGRPLTVAPRAFGNARVAYAFGGNLPTIGFTGHWLAARPSDRAYDGNFDPFPMAPPLFELRGTISGKVPWVRGLSYRLTAQWASTSVGPYVVGPGQFHDEAQNAARQAQIVSAQLNPIDVFRTMIGLRYDFGGEGGE